MGMLTRTQLLAMVEGVSVESLSLWIERGFVLPESPAGSPEGNQDGEPQFAEIDVARVRLIYELEHDLALDPDSIATMLSLLDQVYALRRKLRLINDAIANQPAEVREAILALLGDKLGAPPDKTGGG
jgi:chaperone modulatory protein CbpM